MTPGYYLKFNELKIGNGLSLKNTSSAFWLINKLINSWLSTNARVVPFISDGWMDVPKKDQPVSEPVGAQLP